MGEKMAVQMTLNNRQASQRKLQEKVDSPTTILLHTLTATPMGMRNPAFSSICSFRWSFEELHRIIVPYEGDRGGEEKIPFNASLAYRRMLHIT